MTGPHRVPAALEPDLAYPLTVLSSLLPGIRHVRTPLVVGYLYLGALWLMFGGTRIIPDAGGDSLGERRVAELSNLVGPTLWLSALSLVALLIGTLLTISRWPLRRRRFSRLQPLEPNPDLGTHAALAERLESRFERRRVTYRPFQESPELPHDFQFRLADAYYELTGVSKGINIFGRHEVDEKDFMYNHLDDDADAEVLAAATAQVIVDEEFEEIVVRLLLTSDVAFNEIDRLDEEAELRYSIIPPILAILSTVAITWHWWMALGALALIPILAHGLRSQDRSRYLLVQAIALDVVKSRTLDNILRIAESADHAGESVQGGGDSFADSSPTA